MKKLTHLYSTEASTTNSKWSWILYYIVLQVQQLFNLLLFVGTRCTLKLVTSQYGRKYLCSISSRVFNQIFKFTIAQFFFALSVFIKIVQMKEGYYAIERNKTVWEFPHRYTNLTPIGCGVYGQVLCGRCLPGQGLFPQGYDQEAGQAFPKCHSC